MLGLTTAERKIIESTREEFGEPLTQFLLAGLGEQKVGQRWRFTISYVDGTGVRLKREVQAISHEPEDGSSCLPRGRDPLIFLALIQLFIRNTQAADYELVYDQEDVLNLLGWDDTEETQFEVNEAIKRYFLMTFKWRMNRTELARKNLSSYTTLERPISECGTFEEGEGQSRRTSGRVIFSETFIEQLKRRRLFDIDWNNKRQLTLA